MYKNKMLCSCSKIFFFAIIICLLLFWGWKEFGNIVADNTAINSPENSSMNFYGVTLDDISDYYNAFVPCRVVNVIPVKENNNYTYILNNKKFTIPLEQLRIELSENKEYPVIVENNTNIPITTQNYNLDGIPNSLGNLTRPISNSYKNSIPLSIEEYSLFQEYDTFLRDRNTSVVMLVGIALAIIGFVGTLVLEYKNLKEIKKILKISSLHF